MLDTFRDADLLSPESGLLVLERFRFRSGLPSPRVEKRRLWHDYEGPTARHFYPTDYWEIRMSVGNRRIMRVSGPEGPAIVAFIRLVMEMTP